MKRSIFFLAVFFWITILLYSCEKKYTCSHSILYSEESLVFVGFDTTELLSITLEKYKKASGFSDLISTEIINPDSFYYIADTVLSNEKSGFGAIGFNYDYKIILGDLTYEISDIEIGARSYTWTQDSPCSPGAGQARFYGFEQIKINGEASIPIQIYGPFYSIALVKH